MAACRAASARTLLHALDCAMGSAGTLSLADAARGVRPEAGTAGAGHQRAGTDVERGPAAGAIAGVAAGQTARRAGLRARMDAGPEAPGRCEAALAPTARDPHRAADPGHGPPAQAGGRAARSRQHRRPGQPPAVAVAGHHGLGRRQPEPVAGRPGQGRQIAPAGRAPERPSGSGPGGGAQAQRGPSARTPAALGPGATAGNAIGFPQEPAPALHRRHPAAVAAAAPLRLACNGTRRSTTVRCAC